MKWILVLFQKYKNKIKNMCLIPYSMLCSKEQYWRRYCTLGSYYSCMIFCSIHWFFFIFYSAHCSISYNAYISFRFTLWTLRFGMLYSPHYLVASTVPFVVLERLVNLDELRTPHCFLITFLLIHFVIWAIMQEKTFIWCRAQ